MKIAGLTLLAAALLPGISLAGPMIVGNRNIQNEFRVMETAAQNAPNPVPTVGGIVNEQSYPHPDPVWRNQGYHYSLMWSRSGDPESNFRSYSLVGRGPAGESIDLVTYEGWTDVPSGRFLVRRIIGETPSTQRVDTIDFATGALFPSQGLERPVVRDDFGETILHQWEIGRY